MRHETATSLGLLVLRVGVGGMMLAAHGWSKLIRYPELLGKFPDPLGLGPAVTLTLAVLAEVVCALLVILGLGTRIAAVPLLVTMLVAAFVVHADDPWARQEFALLYAVPFLALVFTGGGRFALDRVVKLRR